jgi:ankyrin repeat protein
MWASSQGRVDAVLTLLQAGADVNAVDLDGVNALMWASGSEATEEAHKKGLQFLEKAIKGQKDVVQLLLTYGAKSDVCDKDGTCLELKPVWHTLLAQESAVSVPSNCTLLRRIQCCL